METVVAKSAGFCFGVKRAVDTVHEQLKTGRKIYTFGPIIHNATVVNELEKKGVTVIDDISVVDKLTEGNVIIRSHGVSKEIFDKLQASSLNVIDATCPFVKKIHRIVSEKSVEGDWIVVIGNRDHPEVIGITGWCEGKNVTVIENREEAHDFSLPDGQSITVVSQTTSSLSKFKELVEILRDKGYNVNVVNTICNATETRQEEARTIASQVDMMIVVGDRKSSNTQKLYEICSRECSCTEFVETSDELEPDPLRSLRRVGITAGASTPQKIIEEVQNYVRINF